MSVGVAIYCAQDEGGEANVPKTHIVRGLLPAHL